MARAGYGWESNFKDFQDASPADIRKSLHGFVHDASPEQLKAWDQSIPPLQREVREVVAVSSRAGSSGAILEYELPMESRRPDVLFLVGDGVLVIELKGKDHATQADLDQAAAYARDLRAYHRDCHDREVLPVLVPTRARGDLGSMGGVRVVGPDALDALMLRFSADAKLEPISMESFLAPEAYCPTPSLVQAARELFQSRQVRSIWRTRAETDNTLKVVSDIIHDAASTATKRLILITGLPGSGKTLVGLRIAHAGFLDDLSVLRGGVRPTAPAVFLSGNGPLVEVLQYELRAAGGEGKAFVRGVKDYVKRYSSKPGLVPPEHVLIFDEAQRAFDAEMVARKHEGEPGFIGGRSEPEHFIEFADRIPEWCVVIGLIGEGQEIHVGEEGGVGQWCKAVEGSADPSEWTVHGPPSLGDAFKSLGGAFVSASDLSLQVEIRFHTSTDVHAFVASLLRGGSATENAEIAARLAKSEFHLRITRDLDYAKAYLRERYADQPLARFGIVASAKDKSLVRFGVANDFQSTKRTKFGPWYGDPEDSAGRGSCRLLESCVTEFGAQGLELDAALLAWGSDLRWTGDRWSNDLAGGYRKDTPVRDPLQLRINAYRVLLTRGRDATVAFVPPMPELDATFDHLCKSGFLVLGDK